MTAVVPRPADTHGQLRRFGEALDAHRMAPRLQTAVPEARGAACHVLDAKYEPGVRATVLYRLGDRLIRGDLVDDRTAAAAVAPGLALHLFPHDPDLPGLAAVMDPAELTAVLHAVLPVEGGRVLGCRVDLLRYRPGKRATLGVGLRRAGARAGGACVVKAYHDARKAAAVATEAGLLAAAADPGGPLRFAPVIAHLPALVVQERVRGIPLDAVLEAPGPGAAAALRRAAAALVALHHMPAVGARLRPVDAELTRFAARSRRVAGVDAAAGGALAHLAARLASTATDVQPGVAGLVHGDCKPSQFLLDGDGRRVVLLDLDSCGRADPAGDVGTFLATLRQRAARRLLARRTGPSGAASATALAGEFLRAYLEGTPSRERAELRRRIVWYEAVALERKALRCFARAPRSPLTAALVDLGHARLDDLGGGR